MYGGCSIKKKKFRNTKLVHKKLERVREKKSLPEYYLPTYTQRVSSRGIFAHSHGTREKQGVQKQKPGLYGEEQVYP